MRQFGWLGTCELVYERLPVKIFLCRKKFMKKSPYMLLRNCSVDFVAFSFRHITLNTSFVNSYRQLL